MLNASASILLITAVLGFCSSSASAYASAELQPPPDPIPRSYFGMHIHRAATSTPWPQITFGSWRLWDAAVHWSKLEPRRGDWDFSILDQEVSLAQQHEVELLLTFGRTPAWASARSNENTGHRAGRQGAAAEPKDIADWRNYVRTVASRYKGRIRGYEIWNEPNLPNFYTGSPETMAVLAREAYSAIKEVDPNAIVVSPSAVGPTGLSWLEKFLAAGGGKYVDVIGYHLYVRKQPPEAMVGRAHDVREIMERYRVGDKPLWNTEAGWQTWSGPPIPDESEESPGYVARSYILNWAAGVRRYYWYAWDNVDMGIRMTKDEKTLTPAAAAYERIEILLVGARMVACNRNGSIWVCELRRDAKSSWLVWSPGGSASFTPPESWRTRSVTPLLGASQALHTGQSSRVGIIPTLFE